VTPFVVSVQTNHNAIRSPKSEGRDQSSMNAGLLDEYISMVLLPYTAKVRLDRRFINKEAMLSMANCSLYM
jgi:hypothetical protein